MDSISLATESLQAQERLHLYLKRENKKTNQFKQTLDQSCIVLDTLRDMKSSLEGSSVQLESTSVCEDILVKIKTIMLMHTPQSLTKEDREILVTLIKESFQDSCREVIFAAMITCPYYSWTQPERGQQAKHNSIFVVYVHKDQQFFAPVNPHIIESSQVIDKEWFYAAEAYHFAHFLCRGKVRCVEMLHLLGDAILYETEAWLRLKSTVSSHSMINLRGCLEQCRGMAAGSVGKKSKQTSKFQLRDTATLYDLCESCRLLGHADSILNKNSFRMVQLTDDSFEHESAKSALLKIKSMYQHDHTTDKFEVFDILMKWKSEIDEKLKGYTYTDQKDFSRGLGEWLVSVRKPHDKILCSLAVRDADSARLQELMALVGGPVLKIQPKNIILIARVGSYLYGLSTPESDADYTIIYAEDIQTILSATTRIKSCTESRGPDKMFEYGAYEAQLFTEMLWKGSVSIAELLFVEHLEYTSDSWKELLNNREKFATEKLIMQYWGLIKNNITSIVHNKYKNQPKERKCFYQIFHKLDCVGDLLEGQCPQVRSQGERREFIMHIRRGELEGEFSRDNLKEKALQKIDDLWDKLVQRKTRLPENVDYLYLQKWLMKVRGWET